MSRVTTPSRAPAGAFSFIVPSASVIPAPGFVAGPLTSAGAVVTPFAPCNKSETSSSARANPIAPTSSTPPTIPRQSWFKATFIADSITN